MIAAGTGTNRRLLGALLAERRAVADREVEEALAHQRETGAKLGEILLEWGLVSRPLLARVLAEQDGVWLEQDRGFGTGLRAEIERRHRHRAGLRLSPVARRPAGTTEGGGSDVR